MHRWGTRLAAASVAIAALVASAPAGAGAAVPDQWTAPLGSAANAAANGGEGAITASTANRLRPAWRVSGSARSISPVIVKGVVYQVVNGLGGTEVSTLVAYDVRTGKRLWHLKLRGPDERYFYGPSVSGDILVLPFFGFHRLAGVTAVSLRTRTVLWSRNRPASTTNPRNDDGTGGPAVVDAGRVYLNAGNNHLSAYDLKTGRLLWHKNPPGAWVEGLAAVGGRLYTGGSPDGRDPSLVVYDGRTGRKLWSVPYVHGRPVVVGRTVVLTWGSSVVGVAAAGCGRSTCRPRWRTSIPDMSALSVEIGGAAGSTAFVSAAHVTDRTSWLMRLSTVTGRVQWRVARPYVSVGIPIRVGNTVWLFENATTITGWSATARTAKPLRSIRVHSDDEGALATLSAAGGTLIHAAWPDGLIGYRVPRS